MKSYSLLYVFLVITVFFAFCTKKDQIVSDSSGNTSTLNAYKTATAPSIDGSVDAIWANATALSVTPTVPDPGNGLFMGYCGEQYPATIQSMYDANNIYFLVKWNDSTNITPVQPWVYDSVKHAWSQRGNSRTFDANGNIAKLSMGVDQLAFQWNIDNSTQNFATQTCYASCHLFTPYRNYAGVVNANASGNHYTNGPNEKVDLWWAKLNRDVLSGQMDDWYLDDGGGQGYYDTIGGNANGRHADGQVKPAPNGASFTTTYKLPNGKDAVTANTYNYNGPISNSQSVIDVSTGKSVTVPRYVVLNSTWSSKPYYTIADTAVRVIYSLGKGVLKLSDSTVLNPTTEAYNYSDDPGIGRNIGSKCIPAFVSQPFNNERANIKASATYTGSGWIVEIQRPLKTGDVLKQDVDFTDLTDRPFGVAIWNTSNNQHGIQPNLLLHFQQ